MSKSKIQEESKDDIIKNIRNIFKLKKGNKAIKIKIISYIRNLFELENKGYYKPVRVGNFTITTIWKYESNSDTDKKTCQLKNILIELNHL